MRAREREKEEGCENKEICNAKRKVAGKKNTHPLSARSVNFEAGRTIARERAFYTSLNCEAREPTTTTTAELYRRSVGGTMLNE